MSGNDSSLKSYIDSATGAAQSALGNLTGNAGDQAQGELRKEQGQAEHDRAHATAKVPGGAVSASGAAVADDPNRTEGSWNQTMGSTKEALGGFLGNESLKASGREQNREGQQQEAKGQLSDLASGAAERVKGTLNSVTAGATGSREDQIRANAQRDTGRTQMDGVKAEVQHQAEKRAEAEQQ